MLKPNRAEEGRIRVVLADDHPEVREEIRQLLASEFDVVSTVGEGDALVTAVADLKPDAVVSDIEMPRMDGIEASCHVIREGLCEAVVALSMYPDRQLVNTALRAGIRAYVLKLDASDELIPAIHAALRGDLYLSRSIRDKNRNSTRNL